MKIQVHSEMREVTKSPLEHAHLLHLYPYGTLKTYTIHFFPNKFYFLWGVLVGVLLL